MKIRIVCYSFFITMSLSCTRKADHSFVINRIDAEQIKRIAVDGFKELGEFNDQYAQCYFEQYFNQLNLEGSHYDRIIGDILIKHYYDKFLNFGFSIVKSADSFYFFPLSSRSYLIQMRNNQQDLQDSVYFKKENFKESEVLNLIVKGMESNHESALPLIYALYQVIDTEVCNNCWKPMLTTAMNLQDYRNWLRENIKYDSRAKLMSSFAEKPNQYYAFNINSAGAIIFQIRDNGINVEAISYTRPGDGAFIFTDVNPSFEVNCP